MLPDSNIPRFGGKLRTESYYQAVNGIIRTLLPLATRQVLADKLNSENITTPSGKPWDKSKVAAYLRHNSISN